MNMTIIEITAIRLAQAEQALTAAQQAEQEAAAVLQDIEHRAAAIERRKAKIRADVEAEKMNDMEAAGAFGLASADEHDLAELRRTAAHALGQAVTVTEQAQHQRDAAATAIEHEERRAHLAALTAHASALEESLCAAIGQIFALGQRLGMPRQLSSVWRPSGALYRAVWNQVPPPEPIQP